MKSYWEKEFWFDTYDFVIIGSGIVGLSAALELKITHPESSILVLERAEIPQGASTKNAGFACFGSITEILDDLNLMSEQEVIDLVTLRWKGLRRLQRRVPQSKMSYVNNGGYEVFDSRISFDENLEHLEHVNHIIECAVHQKNVLEIKDYHQFNNLYEKVIFNNLEAQLNPVQLMRYLIEDCQSNGIRIAFGNEVIEFQDTQKGVELFLRNEITVKATKLVICNNAFIHSVLKDLDVMPVRNQVMISHPIEALKIKGTYHYNKGYVYFRNVGNRLLIGGARNIDREVETTDKFGANEKIVDYLNEFVKHKLGIEDFKQQDSWSGIIASGSNKSPIVKQHSENVFIAVRLGGMGVAIGSEIAYQAANLVA